MSTAVPAGDESNSTTGSTGLDSPSGHQPEQSIPDPARPSSREVVQEQKARFGGMKFGACFFGWLTATGLTLLLASLLSAVGLGVGRTVQPSGVTGDAQSLGVGAAIALLVVIFLGYYAGGYVAGRMARFNGVKQGVGVWLWAVIIAVVLAVLGLIAAILGGLTGMRYHRKIDRVADDL